METNGLVKPQRPAPKGGVGRHFTLEQANRTLPLVKRIVADIVRQYKKVGALEEKCHIRRPSVSSDEQYRLRRHYEVELDKLRELAEELSSIGCDLKDWRRGLVDFRSRHEGREIEFCWRLGEERIEFWHELDAGFPGRRLIDASFSPPAAAAL